MFLERLAGEHVLVAEFVEVASGVSGVEARQAFPDVLGVLRDGVADGVLLADLTRLSRSLTVQEALLAAVWRYSGVVFTADGAQVARDDPDDPMRTAMRQMAGVFAQLERSMIAKRLRDGRKAKARVTDRYAWTFAPWGFTKKGSSLLVDKSSPAWTAVATAHELRAQGLTLRRIAAELDHRDVPTPSGRGRGWNASQAARLLTREPLRE